MKTIIILQAVIIALLLSSCATILQGSKQNVQITSDPPTAKIFIDDEYLGNGFVMKKLKRNKEHIIMVKLDNYETRYLTTDHDLQAGWVIVDLLVGIIPLITDVATGAWNRFDKDKYIIQLQKK